MHSRHSPKLEIFIAPSKSAIDPVAGLDVTLSSLRAARSVGYSISVTLLFEPPQGGYNLNVAFRLRVLNVPDDGAGTPVPQPFSLGAMAREPFYMALELGQAFPWRVPVRSVFQHARAFVFGTLCAEKHEVRETAVLVSGVVTPAVVVPHPSPFIYSTELAQRAAVLVEAMHGDTWRAFPDIFCQPPVLYCLLNADRLHHSHILAEDRPSPLAGIAAGGSDLSADGLYARLRGL